MAYSFPLRTRLTIVASPPEGYEFTIRTPGTPSRWRQYDEELSAVWRKLTSAVCESSEEAKLSRPEGQEGEVKDKDDAVCDIILEVRLLQRSVWRPFATDIDQSVFPKMLMLLIVPFVLWD